MSLLDDVSIVVTPNGYKAGELYAVVPEPTEGAELVTNGDFATDSDWTKGTGWTISGGNASFNTTTNNSLTQSGFANSKIYKVSIDVVSYVRGNPFIAIGQGSQYTIPTSIGTHIIYVTSGSVDAILRIYSGAFGSGGEGSIDNVSVKEYTSADMDVTRATAATRVDENGLVNYAEVIGSELITNGDFATDTDWDKTNATISGGKATITVVSGAYSLIGQSVTYQSGKKYNLTAQVQGTSGKACTFFDNGSNTGGLGISNGIINFDGSLQDVNITFTSNSNSNALLIIRNGSGDFSFTIDNVSVKQVDRDNVPRIDYTGGGCPHILAEPQRTNLIPYSEDFSQNTTSGGTILSDNIISPNGTLTADTFKEDTSTSQHSMRKDISVSTGTYTMSCFVKGTDRFVSFYPQSAGTSFAIFDIENKSITNTGGANYVNSIIEDYGNGWSRCSLTYNVSTGTSFLHIYLSNSSSSPAPSYLGNESEMSFYGLQLESGSYPTSLIPTSGSTVTRNQDIFTRDGIGSLINSTEGTFFVEMATLSDDGTARNMALSDGTTSNRIVMVYTNVSNQIRFYLEGSGGTITVNHTLTNSTELAKLAVRYKSEDFAFYVNGVQIDTNNSSITFSGLNDLSFQNPFGGGSSPLYGKVKQLQVYNTALTDEQLLQLTGTSGTDFYESYAEMASALTYTIQ